MKHSYIQIIKRLDQFASSFSGINTIPEMVVSIENILEAILQVKYTGLYLYDPAEERLKLLYAKGFSDEERRLAEASAMERHPGLVFRTKQMIYVADTLLDEKERSKSSERSFVVRSRLFLPVMNGDNVVGAFGITDPQPNMYDEQDIAILSFICNMAGALYGKILNQKLLEEANREILNLSRLPAESPNPVLRISHEKLLLYANKSSQQLLNHTGMEVGKVVVTDIFDLLIDSIKSGKAVETEITVGQVVYSFISSPVEGKDYINLYGRDITKRKTLENELKRLAIIAKETENAVILSNNRGEIVWANNSFFRISGYELEEVMGKKPADFLVGEETDPATVALIAEAIENKHNLEVDVVNYSKSGKKYWIKLQFQPVFSAAGEIENYISIQKEITRQKEIENELMETTNFQKAILNSSAIAIISTDLNGIILSFNDAATKIYGYQAAEVVGKSTPIVLHDKGEIYNHFQRSQDQSICYFGVCDFLQSKERITINSEPQEFTCLHKNGSRFPVSLTITALRDANNHITGFLGMALDTTERQKQYEAVKIANLRFRSLISSMQAGVMVEDENRKIVLVNEHFCELFSIPLLPDQLIGADCEPAAEISKNLFLFPEMFIADINSTLALHRVVTNFEIQMANGRTLERDFLPMDDSGKKNHGILWIYRDITERKKSELELFRQSQILSGTAQAMNYLLTLSDHDQAIQKALETVGEAIGVDRVYIFENNMDQKTGESFFSQQFEWTAKGIVPQIGNQELQNMPYSEHFPGWYNTLKAGKTVSGLAGQFPENERLILEDQDIKSIVAAPIFVQDQLWGMVGFDDCTKGIIWSANELSIITALAGSIGGSISKRIIENELIDARHVAEYATKTKSEFLATMSHEIRTPMNGVIGMTSLLMQTHLKPDQLEYAETIRVSGELLLDVINDILDFSKIESGKMVLEQHDFDLRLAIEDVLDLLTTGTFEKKLGLYFEVDPAIPLRITGDLTRLRQILVNLVGNAVKFTLQGEVVITVKLKENSDEQAILEFCVKDTGVGIPNEKIGLLFKPFSQVDASTTRKFGGTGLGLAICAKLIGLMHGKIWVKSEVGKGTEFYFTIQTQFEDAKKSIVIPALETNHLNGKKVLLVDPNQTSNKILNSLFISYGMVPTSVNSVNQATLAIAAANDLRLCVVNNDLPANDVSGLVTEIRKNSVYQELPLILLVHPTLNDNPAFADPNFRVKLNKPLKHSLLFTSVKNLLSNSIEPKISSMNQPNPIQKISDTYPLNILVAEDNTINQKLIARLFEMLGYSIHIAANGFEVIDALKRMKIDIVFMDIQMPEMDGLEATRQIISQWGDKKPLIVAMTANALYSDKEKCLAVGMDDYISKPLTIIQVRTGIEKWALLCNSAKP